MQRRTYLAVLASAWLAGCGDITVRKTPKPTTVAGALPADEFKRRFRKQAIEYGMDEDFDLSVPSDERAVAKYAATEATRRDKQDALWNALVGLVSEYDAKRDLDARVRHDSGEAWYRWTVRNEWVKAYDENGIDAHTLRQRIQGTIHTEPRGTNRTEPQETSETRLEETSKTES